MLPIAVGFVFVILNFIYLISSYVISIINVKSVVVSTSPLYMLAATVLPAVWWLYSTKEDAFNFYDRKNSTLRIVIVNDLLVISQAVWALVFNVLVYRICQIHVGRNFSEEMILNLCRIVLCGASLGFTALLYNFINSLLESPEMKENINGFRWQHIVDDRKNITHLYDLSIIRNMQTGKKVPIREVDRFVHMFILGQSGTGKTSSTFIPAIICDLNKKLQNMIERHAAIKSMITRKEAKVVKSDDPGPITEYNVVAEEGYEQKLNGIRKKYPDCGLTVMAPNSSMNKSIIALAKARGQKVNIIDPAEKIEEDGVRMLGVNPLFVPNNLTPDERQIAITNLAQNLSDVLLAVSEIHGVGDPYFRDINSSVTTNVAIICMLHANLMGEQTNMVELQNCIADFHRLEPKLKDIMRIFHMKINIQTVEPQKGRDVKRADSDHEEKAKQSPTLEFLPVREEEVPEDYKAKGYTAPDYQEHLKRQAKNYYPSIYFVMTELLGAGLEKMYDQARGLRNIVNGLLLDPRIADVLCADDNSILNFDRVLKNNEITVINTALEFGAQSSTALGIFIMLNMKLAVMRRARIPEKDRTNHFIYIDEASQYMHPMYEDMFALFRQYKVAVTLALQSLSQMEKTPLTKYLKGVIMGAGIHIVFGRANSDEMKYYEEMSGMENKETIQTSINSNSEFDENYSVSKGQRVTVTREAAMEGAQIRVRDFQEVSVFMIDRGRVMKGFIGKMSFPKSSDYKPKKNTEGVDFSRYADFAVADDQQEQEAQAAEKREAAKEDVRQYETNITSTEKQDAFIANMSSMPKPGINDEIPGRPKVASEEARSRIGRAEALLNQAFDQTDMDRILEESAQKSGIKEDQSAEELIKEQQERYEKNVENAREENQRGYRQVQKQKGLSRTDTERVDYSDPITLQQQERKAIERRTEEALKNIDNDPLNINFAEQARKSGRAWMNPVQNQPEPEDLNVSDENLDSFLQDLDHPASRI